MDGMKALLKQGTSVAVRTVPRPVLQAPDDVLLRVAVAGLCRTDLYVAEGRLPSPDPLILGHEFSGVVEACGAAVHGLSRGDRVAVMPVIWCGNCDSCSRGQETTCLRPAMLGVHRDGAFAEFVALPSRCVYRIPDSLSFLAAAYAEPVAAALAVLNAGLRPEEKGLIYGHNRFSLLLRQVLEAHGFRRVTVHDLERDAPLEANAYDFIVETFATRAALADMMRAVRPYGTIVFKSRQPFPAAIDLPAAIAKELTFRAVNYGPFPKALALLAEGRIEINGLFGPVHPLEDFERVFADARRGEAAKVFFSPSGEHVRHR
jgi:L-iditol 2-dehydrogenase